MVKIVRVYKFGKPGVMRYEETALDKPSENEVLIRLTAIGLNFIDIYHRSGTYPLTLPSTLGMEASGVVEKIGKKVSKIKAGDRIAYASGPPGSYAEKRIIQANKLVKLPKYINDKLAAAMMLKGMTAEYLLNRTYKAKKGEFILFYSAAGGVGKIACQWANYIGCKVIGVVGSNNKVKEARKNGCHYVINSSKEDIVKKTMKITKNIGVSVVYDSVGKNTFEASVDFLKERGMLVSFGQSSGVIPKKSLYIFSKKCLFFTRPSLMIYNSTEKELSRSAAKLFKMIRSGKIKVKINKIFKLKNIIKAHHALEKRKTIGSTVILP